MLFASGAVLSHGCDSRLLTDQMLSSPISPQLYWVCAFCSELWWSRGVRWAAAGSRPAACPAVVAARSKAQWHQKSLAFAFYKASRDSQKGSWIKYYLPRLRMCCFAKEYWTEQITCQCGFIAAVLVCSSYHSADIRWWAGWTHVFALASYIHIWFTAEGHDRVILISTYSRQCLSLRTAASSCWKSWLVWRVSDHPACPRALWTRGRVHLLISVWQVVNFFKQWWRSTQRCRAPSSTVDTLPEQQLGVSGEILAPTEVLSPVP